MNHKLKREKLNNINHDQTSWDFNKELRIEAKKPTDVDPCLRKYNLDKTLDWKSAFDNYHIIDMTDVLNKSELKMQDLVNRILCGDSAQVLRIIPDESVRCIITSPPYWNTVDYGVNSQYGQCSYDDYLDQLLNVWKECSRILKPNGKLCINTPIMPISKQIIGDQHTRHLKNINNDIEFTILNNIHELQRYSLYIWQKQTTEKMFGSYPYPPNIYEQNTIEFINVFVKEGPPEKLPLKVKEASIINETEWMNLTKQIWNIYPEDIKRVNHPAPFPRAIPNRLIAMYTFRAVDNGTEFYQGDVVLDPFSGVGATCLASKELNRNYIGIDVVPDFCIESAKQLESWPSNGKIFLTPAQDNKTLNQETEKLL